MKKHSIFFALFITICSLWLSGCHDDLMYSNGNVYETVWGTISEGNDISVYGDDNKIYIVEANMVPRFSFYDGQRVIINFNLQDNPSRAAVEKNIMLIAVDSIHKKYPLIFSELSEQKENELGHDPVYMIGSWLGGYRDQYMKSLYLNMAFEIRHSDIINSRNMIDVVLDDDNSTETHKILYIHHTKNNNASEIKTLSRFSFDLKNIIPLDASEVKVTINWVDYSGNSKSKTLTYLGN